MYKSSTIFHHLTTTCRCDKREEGKHLHITTQTWVAVLPHISDSAPCQQITTRSRSKSLLLTRM